MRHRTGPIAAAVLALLAGANAAAAEPLFTFADEGKTFLYRARPGDHPTGVARAFGVPPDDLPAFLADNRIDDATRIGAGFVYRIPNPPARALAERTAALEVENARLTREVTDATARVHALTREAREVRASATLAAADAERLAWLESAWPLARATAVVLALLAAVAVAVTVAALQRERRATRWARSLAQELDLKRQAALAERQEAARRVLDLEARVRTLESQVGPRVVVSGRS